MDYDEILKCYEAETEEHANTKALLNSKVDLMEYFLGPDPKKTTYYKQTVRRNSILNDF